MRNVRAIRELGSIAALGLALPLLTALGVVGCAAAPSRGQAALTSRPAEGDHAALSSARRIATGDLRMKERAGSIGSPLRRDDGDDGARLAVALAQGGAETAMDRGDYPAAERILGAALAMNEASAPLFNQLALAYLASATLNERRTNTAMLEFARAASDKAIAINPSSAPAHNTRGLILARLHSYAEALVAFDRARELDRSLFEAHYNAAALRVRFYAYADAERDYREALRVRPGDYDAKVGLAFALRSQLGGDPSLFEARFKEAEQALDAAIAAAPARPEAYLNQALLLFDMTNGRSMEAWQGTIQKARARLRSILAMEGAAPELVRAKDLAHAALRDFDDATHCDFKTTEASRKAEEARLKQEAAEAEANAVDGASR